MQVVEKKPTIAEKLRATLTCHICGEVMEHPATLECRHYFCIACLEHAFDGDMRQCPVCGSSATKEDIRPDSLMEQRIVKFKSLLAAVEDDTVGMALYSLSQDVDASMVRELPSERHVLFDRPPDRGQKRKKPTHLTDKKGRRFRVTLHDLISRKILDVGEILECKGQKAVLTASGNIKCGSNEFKSLTGWAQHINWEAGAPTTSRCDGWKYVRARGQLMADLRRQLIDAPFRRLSDPPKMPVRQSHIDSRPRSAPQVVYRDVYQFPDSQAPHFTVPESGSESELSEPDTPPAKTARVHSPAHEPAHISAPVSTSIKPATDVSSPAIDHVDFKPSPKRVHAARRLEFATATLDDESTCDNPVVSHGPLPSFDPPEADTLSTCADSDFVKPIDTPTKHAVLVAETQAMHQSPHITAPIPQSIVLASIETSFQQPTTSPKHDPSFAPTTTPIETSPKRDTSFHRLTPIETRDRPESSAVRFTPISPDGPLTSSAPPPSLEPMPIIDPVVIIPTAIQSGSMPRALMNIAITELDGTMLNKFTSDVTHVVTKGVRIGSGPLLCHRSLKYALAMVTGVTIVDVKWVEESQRIGKWAPCAPYLIEGDKSHTSLGAPSRSRTARESDAPPLLANVVVCLPQLTFKRPGPQVNEIVQLVTVGGGTVSNWPLMSTSHTGTQVCIVPTTVTVTDIANIRQQVSCPCVTVDWLFDSVSAFKVLSTDKYVP